jgi:ADP-ribose pyrophosphatase YjhB (NUDIX family)
VSSFFSDADSAPRPNQPRRVSVLALIEDERGRLLLDRRADAAVWGLVGGTLEHDETLIDGLRREVREETGCEVATCALFGTFSDPGRVVAYADGNVYQLVSIAYTVRVADPSKLRTSSESRELRFFGRSELPPEDLAAAHQPVIERYLGDEPPPFLD